MQCVGLPPRAVSDVPRDTDEPDPRSRRRGRHGVADISIGFKNMLALFGRAGMSPFSMPPPKMLLGPLRRRPSGDALTPKNEPLALEASPAGGGN
jgi:hypothetical protein